MRAAMRPSLILVLFLGLLAFYFVLGGMTLARAEESASPEPSPTISVQTPSPSPTAEAPNHHLWAKHWAKQARKNRHALKKLSGLLSRPLPALPHRLDSGASDRQWNRYGHRCYKAAVRFQKLKHKWAKAWTRIQRDPVALGKLLARRYYGWTGAEWTALYLLWNRESGWKVYHEGQTGETAYGIPQACPGKKMASQAANWATSAYTQIMWGLRYIAGKFRCPCRAYAYQLANNSY